MCTFACHTVEHQKHGEKSHTKSQKKKEGKKRHTHNNKKNAWGDVFIFSPQVSSSDGLSSCVSERVHDRLVTVAFFSLLKHKSF